MEVPVIRRDELLEIHTSRICAPVGMLMIGCDILLEIQTQGIGAADGGFTHCRQCEHKHEQGN